MTSAGSEGQCSAPQGILSLPPDVLQNIAASPLLNLRDRIALTSCCRALLAWAAAAPPAVWGDLHLRLRARKIPARRRTLASPGLRTWAARLLGLGSPRAAQSASQLPPPHPLAAWLARRSAGLRKVQLHFGGPPWEAAEVLHNLGAAPHLTSLSLSGPAFGSSNSSAGGGSGGSGPSGGGSSSNEGSNHSVADGTLLSMLLPAASLESFQLKECSLQCIPPPLAELPALRALYLPYNTRLGQGGSQALDTLLSLTSLTLLELKGCGLMGVPSQLTALTGLRDLDLAHSRLDGGQAALRPLAALRCLSRLDLSWCSLLRCPEQLSAMTNLVDLSLSYQSLGLGGSEAFEALESLPSALSQLRLEHCGLRALPQQLRALAPSLRELDVSRNPLFPRGDEGGGAGAGGEEGDTDGNLPLLGELSRLTSLTIFDCGLRDVPPDLPTTLESLLIGANPGIADWAPLARLQALARLHIGSCTLGALPLEVAALPRLLCLCASWNKFEGSGSGGGGEDPAFEPLRQLGQLTELALCQCHLQCVPQAVTSLTNLVELDVRSNAGDQPGRGWGAGALMPLLSLPRLARLRAGGNQLEAVEGELPPRLQALLREGLDMEQELDW